MAQSKSTKKLFNMAYGLGASVVIIGALFKILHWEFGPLTGGLLLAVGLITEALIFAISAFEPVDDEYDWSLVYPELANGQQSKGKKNEVKEAQEAEGILSRKLDEMLKEANIDSQLFSSLGESIRSFEGAAKDIAPTTDAIQNTQKYSEELSHAAAQMESLNSLYKVQLEIKENNGELYGSEALGTVVGVMTNPAKPMLDFFNSIFEAPIFEDGETYITIKERIVTPDGVNEFFREPDQQIGYLMSYFTMGQLLCVPMIAGGMYLIYLARKDRFDDETEKQGAKKNVTKKDPS